MCSISGDSCITLATSRALGNGCPLRQLKNDSSKGPIYSSLRSLGTPKNLRKHQSSEDLLESYSKVSANMNKLGWIRPKSSVLSQMTLAKVVVRICASCSLDKREG
uniref:Uncharacterized protein n=1 Tax=Romanomermis culicivorax TaxID=13658 RepID=A0A915I0L2_ROMCU